MDPLGWDALSRGETLRNRAETALKETAGMSKAARMTKGPLTGAPGIPFASYAPTKPCPLALTLKNCRMGGS